MSRLWQCHRCGADGVRNIGVQGWCATHLAELYRTFDPVVFGQIGVMLPSGLVRPEYGPAVIDCACCRCGATAATVVGTSCEWCVRERRVLEEWHAELVLRRPIIDQHDARFDQVMRAWAQRMAVAVRAGLITQDQASRAWRREVARAAA